MSLDSTVHNGTVIAELSYYEDGNRRRIGDLVWFRTNEAKIRLDIIPARAWSSGEFWFHGRFEPSEKVPEAPLVEGDITATTEERGKRIKVGHIHSLDKPMTDRSGYVASYSATLFGIPVGMWRDAVLTQKEGGRKGALYLKIEVE